MLTHYHLDHHGSVGKGGIWYLLEKVGFTFGKFIYRNAGIYKGSKLSECNVNTINWNNVGQVSTATTEFICYATSVNEKTKLSQIAEKAKICSTNQINPPDDQAEVEITIRDAYNVKMSDGRKINADYHKETMPPSENDYSICLRIQYGDFVYVTCGDLTGNDEEPEDAKHLYNDVESSIATMIGEVDVLKVNHHGSRSSTNKKWCKTLKPTVAVISCGDTSAMPHTRPLKNLQDVNSQVYLTNICNEEVTAKFDNVMSFQTDVVVKYKLGAESFIVLKPNGDYSATYSVKKNKKQREECKSLPE